MCPKACCGPWLYCQSTATSGATSTSSAMRSARIERSFLPVSASTTRKTQMPSISRISGASAARLSSCRVSDTAMPLYVYLSLVWETCVSSCSTETWIRSVKNFG